MTPAPITPRLWKPIKANPIPCPIEDKFFTKTMTLDMLEIGEWAAVALAVTGEGGQLGFSLGVKYRVCDINREHYKLDCSRHRVITVDEVGNMYEAHCNTLVVCSEEVWGAVIAENRTGCNMCRGIRGHVPVGLDINNRAQEILRLMGQLETTVESIPTFASTAIVVDPQIQEDTPELKALLEKWKKEKSTAKEITALAGLGLNARQMARASSAAVRLATAMGTSLEAAGQAMAKLIVSAGNDLSKAVEQAKDIEEKDK